MHTTKRWPATLAVLVALGAQFAIPEQAAIGSRWLLPAVQVALLLYLRRATPLGSSATIHCSVASRSRPPAVLLANATTLVHFVLLLTGGSTNTPQQLLLTGLVLVTTNVIATSILLWELDRGGPFARDPVHHRTEEAPDLLFPQLNLPAPGSWIPAFMGYLFVGFTMSRAFSPTATLH